MEISNTFQVVSDSDSSNKGIRITAESPISVYGLSNASLSSDAFLALPCAHLPVEQYEYFGLSYYGAPTNRLNHLVIVGCEDDTEVQFGSDAVVKLNTMETYLWESSNVAGTRIISRKPIAVFVGMFLVHVPFVSIKQSKFLLLLFGEPVL